MQPVTRSSNPPRTGGDWRRRLLRHHTPLALASAVALVLFMSLPLFALGGNRGTFIRQSTFATGYVALALLALTLLIGPANLLLRRRTPISTYLRRDIGTWTTIFSVVHVVLGFDVHGTGRLSDSLRYFVVDGRPLLNSFGLANWTGLAALVIAVALLAMSTDGALRQLKARTWKDLQRLNYTLFALVILHAIFYGALLQVTSPFTLFGLLTVIAVVTAQAAGIWLWRRRFSRPTGTLA